MRVLPLLLLLSSVPVFGCSSAYAQMCPGNFEPTTTALTVAPTNPLTDQSIGLTAVVSPASAVETYGGSLQFIYYNEASPSGVVVVDGAYQGSATFAYTLPPQLAGTYGIIANYIGARYCTLSSEATTQITVAQGGGSGGASLNGQYAFQLEGVLNASGLTNNSIAAVGSFTADGEGNVTAGTADFNSAEGSFQDLPMTGSYTLRTNGIGTLTLISSQGTLTFVLYAPAGQAAHSVRSARLVETDQQLFSSSGAIAMQGPSTFTADGIAGSYAFEEEGETYATSSTPSPIVVGGELSLTSAGKVRATYTGSISGGIETSTAVGTFTTPSATNGRFILTLGAPGAERQQLMVGYVVDGLHFYLMSLDPPIISPLLSGSSTR